MGAIAVPEQLKERTMTGNAHLPCMSAFSAGGISRFRNFELVTDGKGVLLHGSGGITLLDRTSGWLHSLKRRTSRSIPDSP
jgi:hypothetical protein